MLNAYAKYLKQYDIIAMVNQVIDTGAIRQCDKGEYYCVSIANYEARRDHGMISIHKTPTVKVNLFIVNRAMHGNVIDNYTMTTQVGMLMPMLKQEADLYPTASKRVCLNIDKGPYLQHFQQGKVQSLYLIKDNELTVTQSPLYADISSIVPLPDLPFITTLLAELSVATSMGLNKFNALDKSDINKSMEYERAIDLFLATKGRSHPIMGLLYEDASAVGRLSSFTNDYAVAVSLELPNGIAAKLHRSESFTEAFWEYWLSGYKRVFNKRVTEDTIYAHHSVSYRACTSDHSKEAVNA